MSRVEALAVLFLMIFCIYFIGITRVLSLKSWYNKRSIYGKFSLLLPGFILIAIFFGMIIGLPLYENLQFILGAIILFFFQAWFYQKIERLSAKSPSVRKLRKQRIAKIIAKQSKRGRKPDKIQELALIPSNAELSALGFNDMELENLGLLRNTGSGNRPVVRGDDDQ